MGDQLPPLSRSQAMPVIEKEGEDRVYVHEETGAVFIDPDKYECDDRPTLWVEAMMEANAENGAIRADKFRGIGEGVFHCLRSEQGSLDRNMEEMINQAFPIGSELSGEDSIKEAARTIMERIGQQVVPFVADELFKVLD